MRWSCDVITPLTDPINLLNRLNISVDLNGCFEEDGQRVCLSMDRGVVIATVNGHPVSWRLIAPALKPRQMIAMKERRA